MSYFAVDDQAHAHRKFVKMGEDRMPASGLWMTAGSWAAGHLSDGFIPDYMIQQWDPVNGMRLAERLVAVGLWVVDTVDDDKGFRFHEWADRNNTREVVLAKRADAAERQRRSRERRADGTLGPHDDGPGGGEPDGLFEVVTASGSHEDVTPDVTTDVTCDTDVTHNEITSESHHPFPSLPFPSQPSTSKDMSDAPRRTRARVEYSPEFEAFWAAYHPDRREGKGDAAKAFTKACRGAPLREGESRATTLTARVAVWVTHWQTIGTEPRFVPHASKWLNGKRYDDPPPRLPSNLPAVVGGNTGGYRGVGPSGKVSPTTQRIADLEALKEKYR